MLLSKRTKYLEVALNSTLSDAYAIINALPANPRILIEAGTPLIKKYGIGVVTQLKNWWEARLSGAVLPAVFQQLQFKDINEGFTGFFRSWPIDPSKLQGGKNNLLVSLIMNKYLSSSDTSSQKEIDSGSDNSAPPINRKAYIVADLKTMDRAATEVAEASKAGASGAVVLGLAPLETVNAFIDACDRMKMDSMVDMMNVPEPYKILRNFRKLPDVVILHRGVDEEAYSKDKPLPYHNIVKIKGSFDVMLSIAGGDTIREVQRAVFNGVDIAVVWKNFYKPGSDTGLLAEGFLKEIK